METRKLYRDGLEEVIRGPIRVSVTPEGHTVEIYKLVDGARRFFVTLAGSHWCAHGDTIASAIADAVWKDPANRPSRDALVEAVKKEGRAHLFTLNEFRLLTGACSTGCQTALKKAGVTEAALTARAIREAVSHEWGDKLIAILGWGEVES